MRLFKDSTYQTLDSWSQSRRVVGKAEHLLDQPNPRFVVTSYPITRMTAHRCTSSCTVPGAIWKSVSRSSNWGYSPTAPAPPTMRANQLRLWFGAVAYVLVNELRRTGPRGTELARAQVSTIRCHLLKIGARVTVSVRRIVAALSRVSNHVRLPPSYHLKLPPLEQGGERSDGRAIGSGSFSAEGSRFGGGADVKGGFGSRDGRAQRARRRGQADCA